jgi:hypothetical protein
MPHCVVTNIRFINVFVLYLLRIHFRWFPLPYSFPRIPISFSIPTR